MSESTENLAQLAESAARSLVELVVDDGVIPRGDGHVIPQVLAFVWG
ncbi:hypothetical protein [Streptomyces sp. 3214.6]|nr:hypothetical protein [Streptomyces sp. 3214.6]SHH36111.1 hypothetical protein SAMN05444521_0244 [Streptomyces sp. 3214.6]